MNTRINITLAITLLATTVVVGNASAQCCGAGPKLSPPKAKVELKAQTKCPVMGSDIDKSQYVDVKGKRVYICCKGCIALIKKAPEKYLAKIKANGEVAETVLCGKCGVEKGTKGCCDKDAVRCKKCKAIKGSSGCCKLPVKGTDAVICLKCEQIKGTTSCCKKNS